ncbi:MAG: class I SAM-dependent methyltransferase [Rhizobiales bacterium]|nr:class I SAM-dependent methyltransferase [Hyphomicrobiales bacterium]
MKTFIRSQLDRYFGRFAKKSDIDNLYRQLSALSEIRDLVGPKIPIGPLRGWALSPDALLTVLRDIAGRHEPRVVEFGSGESTIAIAAALRNSGAGSLVTIEHDEKFGAGIVARLNRLDLQGYVDFRFVPLRDYDGFGGFRPFRSYDLSNEDHQFDVALIDGPITDLFGDATRSVPLKWSLSRLTGGSNIYLDDAARSGERTIARQLRESGEVILEEHIDCEKGLLRLWRE